MNATPSSQQKGQGSSPSKEALLGAFPEVWEQQGGREGGRERGIKVPSPWGTTAKNLSERRDEVSPSASLLHTATFQKFSVNMPGFVRQESWRGKKKKKNRGAGGNQNLEQFMRPVSILLMARRCCAPRLLQSSQ